MNFTILGMTLLHIIMLSAVWAISSIFPPNSAPKLIGEVILCIISIFFSSIFCAELLMKIFANGLFFSSTAFLKKNIYWNLTEAVLLFTPLIYSTLYLLLLLLGFTVAIFLSFLMPVSSFNFQNILFQMTSVEGTLGKVLGILRLLHWSIPIRAMTLLPFVKILGDSMAASAPFIFNAMVLMAFFTILYSIIPQTLFRGALKSKCVSNTNYQIVDSFKICSVDTPDFLESGTVSNDTVKKLLDLSFVKEINDNAKQWIYSVGGFGLGGVSCPAGSKCVKSRLHSSPNFNSTGFDDAWQAWSSSIHFVSGEGWSDLMHAVIDGTNLFSSAVFIVFLIVGHFVLVNFFVVVITKLMSHRINIFAQNEKNDSQLKAIKLLDDTYELVKKYLEEKYDKFWENYTPVMLLKMQESLMTHWVLNPLITTFLFIVCICNCFLLGFFYYGQTDFVKNLLSELNYISLAIWIVDSAFKLFSVGFKNYLFKDYVNLMDFSACVLSAMQISSSALPAATANAFRLFRAMRFFRLDKSMRNIYEVVWNSVGLVLLHTLNVFVFLVIFAFIGEILFARAEETSYFLEFGIAGSRLNYNTFPNALLATFSIISSSYFDDLTYAFMQSHGKYAWFYFILVYIIGKYLLLSLFIGIILCEFTKGENTETTTDTTTKPKNQSFLFFCRQLIQYIANENNSAAQEVIVGKSMNPDEEMEESISFFNGISTIFMLTDDPSKGKKKSEISFYNSEERAKFRQRAAQFYKNTKQFIYLVSKPFDGARQFLRFFFVRTLYFDLFVSIVVFFSSTMLLFETQNVVPTSFMGKILFWANIVVATFFFLEFLLKLFILGFYEYFRKPWNILDFVVMSGTCLSIFLTAVFNFQIIQSNAFLASVFGNPSLVILLKQLRLLRTLKPLRLIPMLPGLRDVMDAFISSIRWAINVALASFLIFFFFAVNGVNYYNGKLYACNFALSEKNSYGVYSSSNFYTKQTPHSGLQFPHYSNSSSFSDQFANIAPFSSANFYVSQSLGSTKTNRPRMEYWEELPDEDTNLKDRTPSEIENERVSVLNYLGLNLPRNFEIPDKDSCVALGGNWRSLAFTFDSFLHGMFTLFQVCTTQGWIETLFATMDATGELASPRKYTGIWLPLPIFFGFYILGNFLAMNLFSVVLMQNFLSLSDEKKKKKRLAENDIADIDDDLIIEEAEAKTKGFLKRFFLKLKKIRRRFIHTCFYDLKNRKRSPKVSPMVLGEGGYSEQSKNVLPSKAIADASMDKDKKPKVFCKTNHKAGETISELEETSETEYQKYSEQDIKNITKLEKDAEELDKVIENMQHLRSNHLAVNKLNVGICTENTTEWSQLKEYIQEHIQEKKLLELLQQEKSHTFLESIRQFSIQFFFKVLISSSFFEIVAALVIVMNFVTLSLEFFGEPQYWEDTLYFFNIGFTFLFGIELIIRFYGLGFWQFFIKDKYALYNIFDVIALICAALENVNFIVDFGLRQIIDFLRNYIMKKGPSSTVSLFVVIENYLTVILGIIDYENFIIFFRIIRLLRGFRLSRLNNTMHMLFDTIFSSIPELFYLSLLYALLIFTYAIAGMGLFGKMSQNLFQRVQFSATDSAGNIFFINANAQLLSRIPILLKIMQRPQAVINSKQNASFSSFFNSVLMMIKISSGEKWDEFMNSCMALHRDECSRKNADCPPVQLFSSVFFVSFLLAIFIVVNLIIAVLLKHFSKFFDAWLKLIQLRERQDEEQENFLKHKDENVVFFKIKNSLESWFSDRKKIQNELLSKLAKTRIKQTEGTIKISKTAEKCIEEFDSVWKEFCFIEKEKKNERKRNTEIDRLKQDEQDDEDEKNKFSMFMKILNFKKFLHKLQYEFGFFMNFDIDKQDPNSCFEQFIAKNSKKLNSKMDENEVVAYERILNLVFRDRFKHNQKK